MQAYSHTLDQREGVSAPTASIGEPGGAAGGRGGRAGQGHQVMRETRAVFWGPGGGTEDWVSEGICGGGWLEQWEGSEAKSILGPRPQGP